MGLTVSQFFVMGCWLAVVLVITLWFPSGHVTSEIHSDTVSSFANARWTCENHKCQHSPSDKERWSLETCQMLCSTKPPFWPEPKEFYVTNRNLSTFLPEHVFLKIYSPTEEIKTVVGGAANNFLNSLRPPSEKYRLTDGENQIIKIHIHVKSDELALHSSTNESYALYCQKSADVVLVNIFAPNYFGARHGLETLSQLIWYDSSSSKYNILHDVIVLDEPKFSHRGLLIDVSRHYFPVGLLKKAVDGMAASKLNVVHLHASDSASFPLILPSHSEFAFKGAYSVEMTYSPEYITDLIDYAKLRGIRTVIEIDAPSHISTKAWPKEQVLCQDNVFEATLNPDNPRTLDTLQDIYNDLFKLGVDTESFHIGDDEVLLKCWQSTKAAKGFEDTHQLWANFTNAMMERVKSANNGTLPKNIVLWSSPLTDSYLQSLNNQENLVVQYWFGKFDHIINNGNKIIFSTVGQWYLDCGFGPWKKTEIHGSCDPYTDWKKFYKYRPWKDYSERIEQVLGGEVCLWTEQVSVDDLETRLWPRAAAFAERVWTDSVDFDVEDVARRLDFHSRRLSRRGLRVAAIWPQICSLYPEQC